MKDLSLNIQRFIKTNDLPGEEAQMKMAPLSRLKSSKAKQSPDFNPRLSAVMILLYLKNDIWHSALIQRPSYTGVHSAQMSFPGGKQEASDKDFAHTALRETEEEVGVLQNDMTVIAELTEVYIPPSNFLVKPFIGLINHAPTFTKQEAEVADIIEYPISRLLDNDATKEKELVISSGFKLKTPYFDIEDKVVWGATAIILSEFREILRQIDFK